MAVDFIEFIRQVADLSEDWDKTEKQIKFGEHLTSKVMNPSINEMRYAGRHLVDACHATQNDLKEEAAQHIHDAKDKLIEARHHVINASVTYLNTRFDNINEDLGAANFNNHFSKYGEYLVLLEEIKSQISESREYRTRRDEIYDKIMREPLPKLIALYKELKLSLPAIEKGVSEKRKTNKIFLWSGIIGLIIGTISIAVAVL